MNHEHLFYIHNYQNLQYAFGDFMQFVFVKVCQSKYNDETRQL